MLLVIVGVLEKSRLMGFRILSESRLGMGRTNVKMEESCSGFSSHTFSLLCLPLSPIIFCYHLLSVVCNVCVLHKIYSDYTDNR